MTTVLLHGGIKRFTGTSQDTKPQDIPAGSSFLETDTGRIYRFNGDMWTYAAEDTTNELLSLILFELQMIRETVALVTA